MPVAHNSRSIAASRDTLRWLEQVWRRQIRIAGLPLAENDEIGIAQDLALRGVARQLMRNHLKHCAAHAIKQGETEASAMYDELLDLVYKHLR